MTQVPLRRVNDVYSLPPGTKVREYNVFINDEGTIQSLGGDLYAAATFVGYEAITPETTTPRRRETFEEYRQRLCVVARGFQVDHGVVAAPVHALLREFDCWFEGVAEPGQWVYRGDTRMTPPADRLLTTGYRQDYELFGAFTPNWRPLFGGITSTRLARVDGPYPTPTEEDARLIQELKVEVWRRGYQTKTSERWCSAFERMVGAMRIDTNVRVTAPVTEAAVAVDGRRLVSADQRQQSAPGSIFQFDTIGNGIRWNWCQRHPDSTWVGGTRHLLGPNSGSYSMGEMTLIHDNSQPMFIPVGTGEQAVALLEALPIGTHLATNDRESALGGVGTLYKQENGAWHSAIVTSGVSNEDVLRNWPDSHIIEMPGVIGCEPTAGPRPAPVEF